MVSVTEWAGRGGGELCDGTVTEDGRPAWLLRSCLNTAAWVGLFHDDKKTVAVGLCDGCAKRLKDILQRGER